MWTHKLMKMFEIMALLLLISTFCCEKKKVLNFISHFAKLQSRHPHFMQPFLISHVEEECYLFLHFPGPTFINFFCGKLQRKVPSSFHLDFLRKNLAASSFMHKSLDSNVAIKTR